jgi:hypothetical protein
LPDAARFSTPLPDPFGFASRVGGMKSGLSHRSFASSPPLVGVTTEGAKTMTQDMKTLKADDLAQFSGTEHWYRHGLARSVLYTDGAKYVAETGGAYWLLDEIAFSQSVPAIKGETFQCWKLVVRPDHTATLACEDGNGKVVYSKRIEYTDFPLPEIRFFFTDNVILLPSEY